MVVPPPHELHPPLAGTTIGSKIVLDVEAEAGASVVGVPIVTVPPDGMGRARASLVCACTELAAASRTPAPIVNFLVPLRIAASNERITGFSFVINGSTHFFGRNDRTVSFHIGGIPGILCQPGSLIGMQGLRWPENRQALRN